MTTISVTGLTKTYGPEAGVRDVSFDVEAGQVFVLLGPNGAGKTTTVEILEGLRTADEGDVSVLDAPPGTRSLAHRIGVMPQSSDLYAGIRTAEAVRLFAAFYDDHEDPEELMARLGLDRLRKTMYRRLSGGERRRLSLALALVGKPEVAFLDEPTAEMDVEARRETWKIVAELKARGATVVLTTHQLDEAEQLADNVAILRRGQLVALGSPAELGGEPRVTFSTGSEISVEHLSSALGSTVTSTGTNSYRIDDLTPAPELVSRLATWLAARGVLVRSLDAGRHSLEEVYMELTK